MVRWKFKGGRNNEREYCGMFGGGSGQHTQALLWSTVNVSRVGPVVESDQLWSTSMRDKKKRNLLDLVVRGMSVVDCDGTHLGVVRKVEGGHLKILRADQAPRNRHQYVPPDWVVAVDDRVKINRTIDEAKRLWAKEPYAKRHNLERSM